MDEKRTQIVKWFDVPEPKFPVVPLLVGLALLGCSGVVGNSTDWKGGGFLIPVALGVVIIGIVIAIFNGRRSAYNARPSDQDMDFWIEEDVNILNTRALSKTGTDPSELVGKTVVVTGPRFWNVSAPLKFRKGKDGVLRFTPINVTILNFTQSQLVAYTCALDLTTGNPLNESTDEYFYKDVVSVSTKTKSVTYNTQNLGTLQLNSAETFELTTSGGTSVEVVLRDPSLIQRMGGGEIPTTRAEEAIATVRKMLREKKNA